MITREIIAQKLADLDGYFKPQPWNYEAADAILALSLPEPTEGARSQIAANFLRQTMTPLVGRTEPTVSWFGTPDERDVILSALRAMPLQDHAWQDISTAPKEGVFQVYAPSRIDGRKPYCSGKSNIAVMARLTNVAVLDGCFSFDTERPTHWMPLPATPAMVAEDGTK